MVCGIFGVIAEDIGITQKKTLVLDAIAQTEHRGPDAWGLYISPSVGLGHTRLSILDIKDGHQPMASPQSVISYNGELYNYIELRTELEKEGHIFRTRSDTEVIQKMYEVRGLESFTQFNGQFAFLIWDKIRNQLVVARDRYGIRPLYVLEQGGCFYFSSEMKAFDTLADFNRSIVPEKLFEHALLWNTLSDSTIYKNIRSVESGTYEVFNTEKRLVKKRYYQVGEEFHPDKRVPDFYEAKQQFDELMQDSVKLRLRSDVPVGTYLSGGIDSTLISEIANKQTNRTLNTFSVAFEDKSLDESRYQQLASERIKSLHQGVKIKRKDIAEHLSTAIYHTERPVFRTAPVPLHLLSKTVRDEEVKVVLTGEGADEILFGYDSFKELKILDDWKNHQGENSVSDAISKLYPHLEHYANKRQLGFMKMYYEGFLNEFENDFCGLNIRIANNKIIKNYFNKDLGISFDKEASLDELKQTLPKGYSDWSLLQKNSFLEIKTLLQGYLLSSQGDRMAMSHSVEGRFPFLDHRVVELAFALPDEYKLNGFNQKFLLQETYKDVIPEAIINRPKRPYMAPDLIAFIGKDGTLSEIAADMLSDNMIQEYGIFDTKMVNRFLRKFSHGVPEITGYRDNMIFIFMLSTQLCQYWITQQSVKKLDMNKCVIEIIEK